MVGADLSLGALNDLFTVDIVEALTLSNNSGLPSFSIMLWEANWQRICI